MSSSSRSLTDITIWPQCHYVTRLTFSISQSDLNDKSSLVLLVVSSLRIGAHCFKYKLLSVNLTFSPPRRSQAKVILNRWVLAVSQMSAIFDPFPEPCNFFIFFSRTGHFRASAVFSYRRIGEFIKVSLHKYSFARTQQKYSGHAISREFHENRRSRNLCAICAKLPNFWNVVFFF